MQEQMQEQEYRVEELVGDVGDALCVGGVGVAPVVQPVVERDDVPRRQLVSCLLASRQPKGTATSTAKYMG